MSNTLLDGNNILKKGTISLSSGEFESGDEKRTITKAKILN